MYMVWILRDFGIDKYKGWNTKGLLTSANFKKDAFYLYQSFLRPDHAARPPGQQDVLPAPRPRRQRDQGLLQPSAAAG